MQKVRLQEVVTYEKPHSYLGAEPGLELTRGSFQDLLLRTSVNLMLVAGDATLIPGLIPGSGRSPGEGHGNLLQYSCLENSRDRGAWWATVRGVTESDTTEQLTL